MAYMILLAFRSFRDFFGKEIYTAALGREPTPGEYLLADWPGGIIACCCLASLSRVRDNRWASWHTGMPSRPRHTTHHVKASWQRQLVTLAPPCSAHE